MWLNLQHFPQSKKSLKRLTLKHPFVDQHWSFQHTIAKMPSVPNEKEIDSCLADAADAWKPLEGSKAETPCGIDWKHGIQNHLSPPMSKAPAAPFSNCTWLLLKKRPGNFYQNGPKIQTATESSKHEQERGFKQLTPMLPRASRHCKKYTDSEIPVTRNVRSFWEDSMPKQPSKGLDLQLLL